MIEKDQQIEETMTLDDVRRQVQGWRLKAVGDFRVSTQGVLTEGHRLACSLEQAIGEVSIVEALTAWRREMKRLLERMEE